MIGTTGIIDNACIDLQKLQLAGIYRVHKSGMRGIYRSDNKLFLTTILPVHAKFVNHPAIECVHAFMVLSSHIMQGLHVPLRYTLAS